nr:FAD-binding protein [Pseudomonas sp. BIGb0427]
MSLKELVIIGAGVAGMSAALTACELGIAKVVVLEASGEPFSLFKGLHSRHVGPFMYEWPSPFFNDQSTLRTNAPDGLRRRVRR